MKRLDFILTLILLGLAFLSVGFYACGAWTPHGAIGTAATATR